MSNFRCGCGGNVSVRSYIVYSGNCDRCNRSRTNHNLDAMKRDWNNTEITDEFGVKWVERRVVLRGNDTAMRDGLGSHYYELRLERKGVARGR